MASFPKFNPEGYYGVGASARTIGLQNALKNRGTTIKGNQSLRFDAREWIAKFGDASKCRKAMNEFAEKTARSMESYAKGNHPWQNQTGNAEAMLHANAIHASVNVTNIRLSHGVFYGEYLESGTSRMRAFKIIKPTIDRFSHTIHQNLGKIMEAQFR